MRDWRYRDFFSLDLMRKQVWREFKNNKQKLEDNDDYIYNLQDLEEKREEELEAIELFAKNRKRLSNFCDTKLDSIENKIEQRQDLRKNKMTIEFNDHEAASVKSIAVKIDPKIKCTTRFMSGKLLMFAKLSLKSFIYSLVELLSLPDQNSIVAEIYKKYQIERMICYHLLTNTDSTSLQFVIVSDPASTFPECNVRNILFEIFSNTEIYNRFDTSHEFWKLFNVQKPETQKVPGIYEVEHIGDPCYVTLAVNPKEYFEYFESEKVNKKHKGIKKVLLAWILKTTWRELSHLLISTRIKDLNLI